MESPQRRRQATAQRSRRRRSATPTKSWEEFVREARRKRAQNLLEVRQAWVKRLTDELNDFLHQLEAVEDEESIQERSGVGRWSSRQRSRAAQSLYDLLEVRRSRLARLQHQLDVIVERFETDTDIWSYDLADFGVDEPKAGRAPKLVRRRNTKDDSESKRESREESKTESRAETRSESREEKRSESRPESRAESRTESRTTSRAAETKRPTRSTTRRGGARRTG